MENRIVARDSFKLLVVASMLTLGLWFIPFVGAVTYPIRLFVTFIHEAGHALATLATYGQVSWITLDWNESGLTATRGGWRLLISSAGYLSTIVYGSSLLLYLRSPRHARVAAIVTGIALLIITALFGGNLLVWIVGILFGGGLTFLALKAKPRVVHFVMCFLAVQCLLNAFYHLRALLYLSAFDPSIPTDAVNMSQATGGWIPPVAWAILWSLVSASVVIATLVVYYRSVTRERSSISGEASVLLPGKSVPSNPTF